MILRGIGQETSSQHTLLAEGLRDRQFGAAKANMVNLSVRVSFQWG